MADTIYPPAAAFAASAHADKATYEAMYAASIADPDAFWDAQGKRLDWMTPYTKVKDTTFEHSGVSIKWYDDGVLNVSANCIDRHLATRGTQTAIIWEGDNPEDSAHITYAQLHTEVCKLAMSINHWGCARATASCSICP